MNADKYTLDNYLLAEPYLTIRLDARPHGADQNIAARLEIMPEGATKGFAFSPILHGADFTAIMQNKYKEDYMFASWSDDNPVQAQVIQFANWIKNFYRVKLFGDRSKAAQMGYTDDKMVGMDLIHRDEARKCVSMFVRPIMASGVSAGGKKFTSTTAIYRKTKTPMNIANMRNISGKGILAKYCLELSGKTKGKRFNVSAYTLSYDSLANNKDSHFDALLEVMDSVAPLADDDIITEEDQALLNMAMAAPVEDADANGGFEVGDGTDDNGESAFAAPVSDAPVVSPVAPTMVAIAPKPAGAKLVKK